MKKDGTREEKKRNREKGKRKTYGK